MIVLNILELNTNWNINSNEKNSNFIHFEWKLLFLNNMKLWKCLINERS